MLFSACLLIHGMSLAQAQSYSKTFSRSAAMDPGISVQLCQNDMMIVRTPGPVKSVGVTLPNNVEPLFDGNRVILRGNVTTGRTPVAILMQNSDDIYRVHLTACPTRGASTLITIVDDTPAPTGAREYTAAPVATPVAAPTPVPTGNATVRVNTAAATLNPAPAGGLVTIPAPTTVTLEMSRTSTGVTLTVTNGTAQTLALNPVNLKVMAGGQAVSLAGTTGGNLAPGMVASYPVALPEDVKNTDVQAEWNVVAPAVKVGFTLKAELR